jgi:hypothetical protein
MKPLYFDELCPLVLWHVKPILSKDSTRIHERGLHNLNVIQAFSMDGKYLLYYQLIPMKKIINFIALVTIALAPASIAF